MSDRSSILLTDFYELTMMAAYLDAGMQDIPAVFEYSFRALPHNWGYAVFAGIDQLLDDLASLHFTDGDIAYVRSLGTFTDEFLEWAKGFRFNGEVYAAPEGSIVFPNETLVRVHAPLAQAQLVETLVLNRLNYQTLVATKASRCVRAAEGDPIIEFGLRRAQGPDGGVSGARAAFVGGCVGTSNVLAGKRFGIPVMGTHAHSWVMAFESELEAFRAYVRTFPRNPVLLLDTYDTLKSGLPNAITVFSEMREQGIQFWPGVRLDSGDLAKLSKEVYRQLVEAGFDNPTIVASNELDEDIIADLKRRGAKINAWGVGTKLVTGGSEPALGGIYKLSAVAGSPDARAELVARMKRSDNPMKATDPGVKMPVRFFSESGEMLGDVVFMEQGEPVQQGEVISQDRLVTDRTKAFPGSTRREPLIAAMMRDGKRPSPSRPLPEIRKFAEDQLGMLPAETRRLASPETYWVGRKA